MNEDGPMYENMNGNKRDYAKIFNIAAIVALAIFAIVYVVVVAFSKTPNGMTQKQEILVCLPLAVISSVLSCINMIVSKEKATLQKKVINFIMLVFPVVFIFASILLMTR